MALSNEGIRNAKENVNEIRASAKELIKVGEELKNLLQNDVNYQYFKAGTDKGQSVDSDLIRLLDTIVNMLVPQTESVSNIVETFCVQQEKENMNRN